MTEENPKEERKEMIKKLHPEDELQVEEKKLKEEHNDELLDTVEEKETKHNQERMIPEDSEHAQKVHDKNIEQGNESGKIKDEEAEDIYDPEESEELVEDDEISAAEEGFVRGYEAEEGSEHSKKKKEED